MAASGWRGTLNGLREAGEGALWHSGGTAWRAERRILVRLVLFVTAVFLGFGLLVAWQSGVLEQFDRLTIGLTIASAILFGLLALAGRLVPYAVQAGAFLLLLWLLGLQGLLENGFAGQATLTLFLFVILAFALFDLWVALLALAVAVVTLGAVGWLVTGGRIAFSAESQLLLATIPNLFLVVLRYAGIAAVLMLFAARVVARARQALREQEAATARHGRERQQIAQQVAEQTRALRALSEISRLLSTVRDRRRVSGMLADLIQDAFDYYHVELYTLGSDGKTLRLAAATGNAGKLMLAQQTAVPLGKGLPGEAAARATAVLQPNIARSDRWRPNPLLPETRAETAVPVFAEGQLWGVIDVQSDRVGGLSADDTAFLASVASQIGVALRNISRYEAAQARADREALLSRVGSQIQLAPDADALLKVAARELALGLQTEAASIVVELDDEAVRPEDGAHG